jgi:hypothetical protein
MKDEGKKSKSRLDTLRRFHTWALFESPAFAGFGIAPNPFPKLRVGKHDEAVDALDHLV